MRYDDIRLGEDYDSYSIPIRYYYKGKRYGIMNYAGPYYRQALKDNGGPYFWFTISEYNASNGRTVKIYMNKPEYVIKSRRDVFNLLTKDDLEGMIKYFKSDPKVEGLEPLRSYLDKYKRIEDCTQSTVWEYFLDKINAEDGNIMPANLPMPDYNKLPTIKEYKYERQSIPILSKQKAQ